MSGGEWPAVLGEPLTADLPANVHRLRSRSATSALLPGLRRAGWSTAVVDLVGATDKTAIVSAFARGLGFPPWVGHNWDALDDALRDLSWWPAGSRGRVVVVRGAGRARTGTAQDRALLRDVMETAAARWATSAAPLVVLLRR
jgi:hypothetical protein